MQILPVLVLQNNQEEEDYTVVDVLIAHYSCLEIILKRKKTVF